MKSLRELYRIGNGPSSSHTMGVASAAQMFKTTFPTATGYKVILYGSLASTGMGHCTDKVLIETLAPKPAQIIFDIKTPTTYHPNTLDIFAYNGTALLGTQRYYSVGGGAVEIDGQSAPAKSNPVYELATFKDIKDHCQKNNMRLYNYVYQCEPDIKEYLAAVWQQMKQTIASGLQNQGTLPGPLKLKREAPQLYTKKIPNESAATYENRLIAAYAYAVSEENASGGRIVTAPTCGACGVLPAVLYYLQKHHNLPDTRIVDALATAGLVGNLIKTNASISGAECGCQAEIGSACSMAAAAASELHNQSLTQIEYASEIAMEHHLGLTCDPICGLVQIPCIERNAVAAMRALNASRLAWFLTDTRRISFDLVVQTMYETGLDLNACYKETATGGLAKLYQLPSHKIGKIR